MLSDQFTRAANDITVSGSGHISLGDQLNIPRDVAQATCAVCSFVCTGCWMLMLCFAVYIIYIYQRELGVVVCCS